MKQALIFHYEMAKGENAMENDSIILKTLGQYENFPRVFSCFDIFSSLFRVSA